MCCTKGSCAATLDNDLMPSISLNFPYRRSRRRYWFIVGFRFSRAHMATVASQEEKFKKALWRLLVHCEKASLGSSAHWVHSDG